MMHQLIWVVVVVAAIAILLAIALFGVLGRKRRAPFETRMFPQNYVEPYERRIDEVERMFVAQPREAVAAAKLLVDDMLTRMGYPVRISNEERARDLRYNNRTFGDRYRTASRLKSDPSTEDLRRSLQAYLATARDLVGEARKRYGNTPEPETRPEIAG